MALKLTSVKLEEKLFEDFKGSGPDIQPLLDRKGLN